jgi:hypothetical protein
LIIDGRPFIDSGGV